jgi:hypothetical protein
VAEYVKKWKIDAIITFDDGGVSGHINHRAVGAGVRYSPVLHSEVIEDILYYRKGRIYPPINFQRYLFYGNIRFYWIYLSSYFFQYRDCWLRCCEVMELDHGVLWSLVQVCISLLGAHLKIMQVKWFGIGISFKDLADDRWIYMILSRYMYVNEVRRILP